MKADNAGSRDVRRFAAALFFSLILSLPCAAFAVRTGGAAPDFALRDTMGRGVTLSSFRGKVVALNFWASTCPHCLAELPSLENLYRDLRSRGFVVLGVAVERNPAPVKEVIQRKKLTFPVVLDTDNGVYFDSYGLFGLPVTLIINREGIVVERIVGEVQWDSAAMKEELKKLL